MATFSIWSGRFIQRKGPMGSPTIGPQWGQTPVTFIIFAVGSKRFSKQYIRDIADTLGKGREGQ